MLGVTHRSFLYGILGGVLSMHKARCFFVFLAVTGLTSTIQAEHLTWGSSGEVQVVRRVVRQGDGRFTTPVSVLRGIYGFDITVVRGVHRVGISFALMSEILDPLVVI